MPSTLITKYGSGAPLASDLVRGELAVDTENGRLYTEDSGGSVIEIGLNPSGNVDVTGTLTADGALIEGSTGLTIRNDAVGANEPKLVFDNDVFASANYAKIQTGNGGLQLLIESPSTSTFQNRHQLVLDGGSSTDVTFKLSTDNGTSYKNQLQINNNDVSFYEDTGTTAKLFWDASAESLGLGSTTPDSGRKLHIEGDDTTVGITLKDTAGTQYGIKSDANSFIIRNDNLALDRLVIDTAGNVGIGTASPSFDLDVRGSDATIQARATNASGTATLNLYGIDSTGSNLAVTQIKGVAEGATPASALTFSTRNSVGTTSEAMRIDSSGNVQIGSTSSDGRLKIAAASGASAAAELTLWGNNSGGFGGSNIAKSKIDSVTDGTAYGSILRMYTNDTSNNYQERMRIDSSGDMNIVNSGLASLNFTTDGSTDYARITGGKSGSGIGELQFWTYSSGISRAATIDQSGNLLVGKTGLDASVAGTEIRTNLVAITSAGDAPLYLRRNTNEGELINFKQGITPVGGIGTSANDLTIYSSASGHNGLRFHLNGILPTDNTGAIADADADLGDPDYRFKDLYLSGGLRGDTTFSNNAGTTEYARFDTSGNLLVGTTSDPAGSERIRISVTSGTINGICAAATTTAGGVALSNRNSSGTYVGGVSFTNTATSFPTSSDQRLKENIVDAPSASDDIDAIQVRSFNWKADGSHQKYGMVAQELLTVAPEAVSAPEDPEEMMGVDYSKLVPMLVKEVQQLRARVAQLESK